MRYTKDELISAIKWQTGDKFYDLKTDYLHLLTSDKSIERLISSYREFAKMQNLQFRKYPETY